MLQNFMLQDVLGVILAFVLFSFVFVFPGYVFGWFLDLFQFRNQTFSFQLALSIFISAAVTPAVLFLIYRFVAPNIVIGVLFVIAIAAILIHLSQTKGGGISASGIGHVKPILALALLWVVFSFLILIDFQTGNRLYFSNNSYDMLTRVSVVNAITRTGVPPVNPSYYPGHEVRLNFLYYYWYILASLVDQIGGTFVSAYHAMTASISWCGIVLFAAVASYLRVRSPLEDTWKKTFIAMQLFAVSGLDCIIIILAAINVGYLPANGSIEGWNMPIMSWLNALAWVPHHVTAAIACIFSLSILMYEKHDIFLKRIFSSVVIGLAFASAFGLSVWVMFVFAIFWVTWMVFVLIQKNYANISVMALGGVFALIFVSPFLAGLIEKSGGTSMSSGALPVSLYVRPFVASAFFPESTPSVVLGVANFFMLPLNYLFEFGFFFIMAAIWIQEFYFKNRDTNPIYKAELVLVAVTTATLSFLYSTLIAINDLGIRGWLPVQIILIVWSADLIMQFIGNKKWVTPKIFRVLENPKSLGLVLGIMISLGMLTSSLEAISLRMWSILIDMNMVRLPNSLSNDNHLGERTYYARLAYEYLNQTIPSDVVVQNNPLDQFDRPSGLYGDRQMVISDRTIYGVSLEVYKDLSNDIGSIFTQRASNWEFINAKCNQYSIDILVIKDTDPIWNSLPDLRNIRAPIYENAYHALYSCGNQ